MASLAFGGMPSRRWRAWVAISVLFAAASGVGAAAVPAAGSRTFRVTAPGAEPDANPGDGTCASAAGFCTLRAAIDESDARPGADTVVLPPGSYEGGVVIRDALTISGAGREQSVIRGRGIDDVLLVQSSGSLRLSGVTLSNEVFGKGILNEGTVRIEACAIRTALVALTNSGVATASDSDVAGGGIHNTGMLLLYRSTLAAGRVLLNEGSAEIESCEVRQTVHNAATGRLTLRATSLVDAPDVGADTHPYGLTIDGGDVLVEHSRIAGNRGGGIRNADARFSGGGRLALVDSEIANNGAGPSATEIVGGLWNAGQATVERSTISGNLSGGSGGGIFNASGGTLTVRNATISGNRARVGGGVATAGAAELSHVTLTDNVARSILPGDVGGGGLAVLDQGTLAIAASIVAGNAVEYPGPRDCAGVVTSHGDNLLGEAEGCDWRTDAGRDVVGVDARLDALQAVDGGRPVHPLLADSPAIDVVRGACAATDERGVTRPRGPRCDAGAFEVARGCGNGNRDAQEQCDDGNTEAGDCCSATCQFEAIRGDCDADGRVTVAELVHGVGIAAGEDRVERCPAIDTDGDGAVSIADLIVAVDTALSGCRGQMGRLSSPAVRDASP